MLLLTVSDQLGGPEGDWNDSRCLCQTNLDRGRGGGQMEGLWYKGSRDLRPVPEVQGSITRVPSPR